MWPERAQKCGWRTDCRRDECWTCWSAPCDIDESGKSVGDRAKQSSRPRVDRGGQGDGTKCSDPRHTSPSHMLRANGYVALIRLRAAYDSWLMIRQSPAVQCDNVPQLPGPQKMSANLFLIAVICVSSRSPSPYPTHAPLWTGSRGNTCSLAYV